MRQGVGWMVILGSTFLGVYGLTGIAATPFATPIGTLIGIIVGPLSIIAPLTATWSPRVAARLYLGVAPTAPLLLFAFSEPFGYATLPNNVATWDSGTAVVTAAIIYVGSLVVPCFFWHWVARREWPPLLAQGRLSRRPWFAATLGSVIVISLFLVAMILSFNLPWLPVYRRLRRPAPDQ